MNLLASVLVLIAALLSVARAQEGFSGADDSPDASDDEVKRTRAQIDWLVEKHGGYVNPKISFAALGDLPSAAKGVFVSEDVPRGETLIVLPRSAILKSGRKSFLRNRDLCETAKNLMKQYRLGEKSDYWPYVNHVFSNNIHGRLPSQWSTQGKQLLHFIKSSELRPWSPTSISYAGACIDDDDEDDDDDEEEEEKEENELDNDPLIEDAYMIVVSRSWDDKLLPIYDMISHRNGNWTNVDSNSAHQGKDVFVFAVRDIKKGEQLYLSYNECSDCEEYAFSYTLPELLRDYGFVEQYPQRWAFKSMVFDLDVRYVDGEEQHYVTWREETKPSKSSKINFLVRHYKRLLKMNDMVYKRAEQLTSSHERSVNLEFYEGMKRALRIAIEDVTGGNAEEEVCNDPSCQGDW